MRCGLSYNTIIAYLAKLSINIRNRTRLMEAFHYQKPRASFLLPRRLDDKPQILPSSGGPGLWLEAGARLRASVCRREIQRAHSVSTRVITLVSFQEDEYQPFSGEEGHNLVCMKKADNKSFLRVKQFVYSLRLQYPSPAQLRHIGCPFSTTSR